MYNVLVNRGGYFLLKNTIFYSWQSNLPNSSNRGFIEQCIKNAIRNIENSKYLHLEMSIERDTKGVIGTPGIVDTLFKKIDSSKLFIADVSIINSNSKERKTPNPNVLLELGYAAKSLGWNNVLCFFNLDYGSIEDLPFDIKFRRIITYSINNRVKSEVRSGLAKIISATVEELFFSGLLDDDINDFFKVKIDTQLLTVLKSLANIVYAYNSEENNLNRITKLLNLSESDMQDLLLNKEFIGFQVHKNFREIEEELTLIFKDFVSSMYFKKELGIIVANIIKWIKKYNKFISLRTHPNLFIHTSKVNSEYYLLDSKSLNPTNKEGYLLLRKIDGEKGMVVDFGDIQETLKVDSALESVYLNEIYHIEFSACIKEFLRLVEMWLDKTNGEFFIDNIENFEFRRGENPYLKSIGNPMQESLLMILKEGININYYELSIFNAISILKSYGYIFSDESSIKKIVERYTAIKFNLEEEITSLINYSTIENPIDLIQPSKENFELLKNKEVKLDSIYMPHILVKKIKALILLQNTSELEIVKVHIDELLKKINENLVVLLPNVMERLLREVAGGRYSDIDLEQVAEEFENIRNYHEKELNILLRGLKKVDIQKILQK